jgi:hypothetical protein
MEGGNIAPPDQDNQGSKERNWPHKPGLLTICIVFYCDIEPTSKKVVPLAGDDYSLHNVIRNRHLYETF